MLHDLLQQPEPPVEGGENMQLASHESTATAVLNMWPSDLLVRLWRAGDDPDASPYITSRVIDMLTRIARHPGRAEGVVTAIMLSDILNGLRSVDHWTRLSTCELLRALAGHKSTVQAVVEMVPREDILALFSDRDDRVRMCVAETLRELDATLEILGNNFRNR
ncbi:hypothetical protein C8J57DRAFT_400262 [Mycena rebaudengoi]|nr:hypothetical protein C8J57DRAFT_400262 [Mycena rebaudengoi]